MFANSIYLLDYEQIHNLLSFASKR